MFIFVCCFIYNATSEPPPYKETGQNNLHLFVIFKISFSYSISKRVICCVYCVCLSKFVASEIILKFFPNFYQLLSEMFSSGYTVL